MKELGELDKRKTYNYWNGILLLSTFFIFRILFIGVFLGAYIIPLLITYPYDKTAAEIGWLKVRWAQTLMVMFVLLYILNIFWFKKLILGYRKYRRTQALEALLPKENNLYD